MLNTVFTDEHRAITHRLIALRERAGLSQRELAERLAVNQTFVSKIETRERNLNIVVYIVVCRGLGATPEEVGSIIADVTKTTTLAELR